LCVTASQRTVQQSLQSLSQATCTLFSAPFHLEVVQAQQRRFSLISLRIVNSQRKKQSSEERNCEHLLIIDNIFYSRIFSTAYQFSSKIEQVNMIRVRVRQVVMLYLYDPNFSFVQ
uniref:Uncharacterized protein n=1 Tax=Parascaris equorum TaxID=6256 RepID=A0A914RXG6_PAREQ